MLEEFSRRDGNSTWKFGLFRILRLRVQIQKTTKSLKAITSYQVISTGNGFGVVGWKKRPALVIVNWPPCVVVCEVEEAGLISCPGRALTRQ
jgi:hypothetical protein